MPLIPGGSFSTESVQGSNTFEPMPEGRYSVQIIDSAVLETKAGDGQYLKLTFQVLEPDEFNGRLVWTNLNLVNRNEKAVEIAQRELKSICQAAGLTSIDDSSELHGIPMTAKVKILPERGGYPPSNGITGYKELPF